MQARRPENKSVAAELRRMAGQYQQRAAKLDGGTLPDIEAGSTATKRRDRGRRTSIQKDSGLTQGPANRSVPG